MRGCVSITMPIRVLEELGRGKEGVVNLVKLNGTQCVCKQFKSTKSVNKIKLEAELQRKAHLAGVAPRVLSVNEQKKQLYMEFVPFGFADLCRDTQDGQVTPEQRQQLLNIMSTLDSVGVLHNDGNIQNLRMDYSGKMYLLDYGMSKKITPALTKKWGPSPNHKTTLFMMKRSFRHNNIEFD